MVHTKYIKKECLVIDVSLCNEQFYIHLDVALTLAPWSINSLTISEYPPDAASISGVESPMNNNNNNNNNNRLTVIKKCRISLLKSETPNIHYYFSTNTHHVQEYSIVL